MGWIRAAEELTVVFGNPSQIKFSFSPQYPQYLLTILEYL